MLLVACVRRASLRKSCLLYTSGLRTAMTRTLNQYIEQAELAKKAKVETTGDDMREGICCVPVSYTHLDVYKRQQEDCCGPGEKHSEHAAQVPLGQAGA